MDTQDQPLDNQPQDTEDDFDSAFDEYAGGGSDEPRSTDDDFAGGEQDDDRAQDAAADDGQGDQGGDEPADEDMTPRERELQAQLERLRHSEASQRGRLGAYQRQINELQRRVQERQQAAPQAPAAQRQAPAGQDPASDDQQKQDIAEEMGSDDWETFKEDFPDMARALESRLATDRQQRAQLEREVADLRSTVQPIQQQAQEEHLKVQEDALAARHPDWREVVAAPAFAEWLNQQPESLQALTNSEDAAEAAALLDMYRAQAGGAAPAGSREGTPDKRQQRLAAAQSVGRRGAPRRGAVDDDFDAAFDHYASKKGAR